ncbi:unnamed protein product [Camellia sinensis]
MYELFNGHQGRFEDAVNMSKPMFLLLCDALRSFGLTLSQREHGVPLEEKVAIFICALQGMDWKDLQEWFQYSKETLSRNFHEVLQVIIPFTSVHSRSLTPKQVQQGGHPHLQLQRQYRPFKDCIGALDGIHVMARVSQEYATSYYGRKGMPTQNILAVCDFDLCFTFVSASWDESMHGSRVLHYVTAEPKHRFPHHVPVLLHHNCQRISEDGWDSESSNPPLLFRISDRGCNDSLHQSGRSFLRKNLGLVDDYSRIAFHNSATMEWLCVRINFLFNVVFFLVLVILVNLPRSAIEPS